MHMQYSTSLALFLSASPMVLRLSYYSLPWQPGMRVIIQTQIKEMIMKMKLKDLRVQSFVTGALTHGGTSGFGSNEPTVHGDILCGNDNFGPTGRTICWGDCDFKNLPTDGDFC